MLSNIVATCQHFEWNCDKCNQGTTLFYFILININLSLSNYIELEATILGQFKSRIMHVVRMSKS